MITLLRIFKKLVGFVLKLAFSVLLAFALVATAANALVYFTSRDNIVTIQEAIQSSQQYRADCIVVLGASVFEDGTLSDILRDRVDDAIFLYKAGVAPKIIMSGDGADASYNEPGAMKAYAVAHGVPSQDIFCDRAGTDTYNTMARVAQVFGARKIAICTQTYHMFRCIYTAHGQNMVAFGVPSDYHQYANQAWYDVREFFSRTKAVAETLTHQPADQMEEPISLADNGDITNK